MKIQGKFIKVLPEVEGETAKGHWVRGGFVIETFGDYPKKVMFTTFGEDKVKMAEALKDCQPVEVDFMPENREFNGRWYTECKATSIKPMM